VAHRRIGLEHLQRNLRSGCSFSSEYNQWDKREKENEEREKEKQRKGKPANDNSVACGEITFSWPRPGDFGMGESFNYLIHSWSCFFSFTVFFLLIFLLIVITPKSLI
jgi:hypothetical protein